MGGEKATRPGRNGDGTELIVRIASENVDPWVVLRRLRSMTNARIEVEKVY